MYEQRIFPLKPYSIRDKLNGFNIYESFDCAYISLFYASAIIFCN